MPEAMPSRMTKKQLRQELIDAGFTTEQLAGKKREDMIDMVRAHRDDQAGAEGLKALEAMPEPETNAEQAMLAIAAAEMDEPEARKTPKEASAPTTEQQAAGAQKTPEVHEPGWTQFVLGLFQQDEVEGESPRVDGLRRVASMLFHGIVEEGCDVIQCPSPENGERAVVKGWFVFGDGRRFEAAADCDPDNAPGDGFEKYPVAIAETRAKGRALRAALQLRRIVAAEEKSSFIPVAGDPADKAAIEEGNISVIQILADRVNGKVGPRTISIQKVLDLLEIKKTDLRSLTKVEGQIVTKTLNQYARTGTCPESVLA